MEGILSVTAHLTNSIKLSDGNPELKLSADKNYYETGVMSVAVTTAVNTEFSGFKFTINSNNYTTTVVDENNNEITDLATIATGKKFKIRVAVAPNTIYGINVINVLCNASRYRTCDNLNRGGAIFCSIKSVLFSNTVFFACFSIWNTLPF